MFVRQHVGHDLQRYDGIASTKGFACQKARSSDGTEAVANFPSLVRCCHRKKVLDCWRRLSFLTGLGLPAFFFAFLTGALGKNIDFLANRFRCRRDVVGLSANSADPVIGSRDTRRYAPDGNHERDPQVNCRLATVPNRC